MIRLLEIVGLSNSAHTDRIPMVTYYVVRL